MGDRVEYHIEITKIAHKHLHIILKSGTFSDRKKIDLFLEEIRYDPRIGIGKPEQLKYVKGEIWSRVINKKDRFIYEIREDDKIIIINSMLGHYDDK